MRTSPRPHRWLARAGGAAAVLLFLVLVARFWHPVYGFTAFLQLDSSNDDTKIAAFREFPVYVYRDTGGYDGLYYAQIAYHPSLTSPELAAAVDGVGYRGRRILPPFLAWALALGDPRWIVHVYSVLNVAAWLVLAACLWTLLDIRDARGWAAWAGVLFSAGALSSVRLALTDLIALALLAGAMLLFERGRRDASLGMLAAAGLARETSLAALPGFWTRPWLSRRNAAAALAAVAPLAAWIGYIRWRVGESGAGARNFAWPMAGWVGKWRETLNAFRTEGDALLVAVTLLGVVGLTAQAAFFVTRPRPGDRWWRIGAAYTLLFLVLGAAVWEGFPGAATRVLLPLSLAFNVVHRRGRSSLAWLLIGNLPVAAGLLALKDVPRDPSELAAARLRGVACVVTLGTGWNGLEHDSHHRWAWSGGRARIDLETWPKETSTVRLEFAMSSLAPRIVTLRHSGREVWRGDIGAGLSGRQLVSIPIENGRASIEFATDIPAVRESENPNARALSFAIYDPRLDLAER